MRRVEARLAKLDALAPKGCAVCRRWCHVAMVNDEGRSDRPERCPGCGRLVPITTTLHIVGVDLGLL